MPIVVGVPRSGTTLLRLMLDAHPHLAIPPDTGFLWVLAAGTDKEHAIGPEELYQLITTYETWDDFGLSKTDYLEALKTIQPFSVPAGLRAFCRLYAQRHGKLRWGDKTPTYSQHIRQIQDLLPEAHFIHIIRDGRDVAASLRLVWFAPGKDLATLASYWKSQIENARAQGAQCRHYMEIRYEQLVQHTQHTLRAICDFIDLAYDPGMQAYHRSARERLDEIQTRFKPDGTVLITKQERLLSHRRTSAPPDPTRIGRWRVEMARQERALFESIAGDLLCALGYQA